MTTTTMTAKLVCPECAHENEAERIYCHSCGARLDRSAVRTTKTREETVKETQRRVRNLFDPTRAKVRLWFFRVAKLVLGACAAAAAIEMIMPPDVPPPVKQAVLISQLNLEVENAITYHRPPRLQYTEEQVNAYLTYTLKNKQSALNKPLLDFKRALVAFDEGQVKITVERSLYGMSIYSSTIYGVNVAAGQTGVVSKGGSIGRVSIHPKLMQYIEAIFGDVWSALDREHKLIAKMQAIEFHPKLVVLTAAAGPTAPAPAAPAAAQ